MTWGKGKQKRPRTGPEPLHSPLHERVYIEFRYYEPEARRMVSAKGTGIRLEYIGAEEVISVLSQMAPPAPVRRVNITVRGWVTGRRKRRTFKTFSFEGSVSELREELVQRLRELAKLDAPILDGLGTS